MMIMMMMMITIILVIIIKSNNNSIVIINVIIVTWMIIVLWSFRKHVCRVYNFTGGVFHGGNMWDTLAAARRQMRQTNEQTNR